MNKEKINNDKHTFKLTEGQQKAVDIRDANVLVAAAAGSGKTKVLVDRIMSKVTDVDKPVNVDKFLVVTFTNAAAAQMREKIREKLQEALEKNPESEHLKLQQLLVNRAAICTIDSYCLKLVRENFNLLDIDTSFTIGDTGMMELVKTEVMNQLFEKLYDDKDEEFRYLVDIFGTKNQEEALKKAVSDIYYKASSYPSPRLWLEAARDSIKIENEDDLDNLPWISYFITVAKSEIKEFIPKANIALMLCSTPGGPDKYEKAICDDIDVMESLIESDSYEEFYNRTPKSWTRLGSCKGDAYDQELIDEVKQLREDYKKQIKDNLSLKKSAVELIEELKHIATYLVPLLNLVEKFMDAFMAEKRNRRMLEFSDIEHMAHQLVCKGYKDGVAIPTALAKNVSMDIEEIYIDEYQDSNYLQEDILSCVSGNSRGYNNMFMVGDVKQSIYRFRMARPELFIEKYNSFCDSGDAVKILLNNNFRSRDVVLEPVNYFFYQLMGADLGGIQYDKDASLVPTMKFPEPNEADMEFISHNTEIMVLNLEETDEESGTENESEDGYRDDEELDNMKNLELEAHMIADRILKLVDSKNGMMVLDEVTKEYRRATYKDIVILTRSMKGVGEQFYNVLNSYGIPVYVSDPKGYFDAVEIRVVMSVLAVVDNSKQDIPLAAAIMSPIGSINESELAKVCDYSKQSDINTLYDRCQLYMLEFDDNISTKLKSFFNLIGILKDMKNKVSISQLIWEVLDKTGYYIYAASMPMGHRRKANLDMLLEKADAFEDGYYKGLFNFLRYVEKLKINQVDFGEALAVGDDEDVVRIMTMHASKGLEYPIVFVSALGKQFNKSEYKDKLIINSDYYLAMTYMNTDKRYSKDTFIREAFKEINKVEGIAEEFRVLYVALTRAKEKLIMTGHTKKLSKLLEKFNDIKEQDDKLLPYGVRKKSQSFIELIIAAMVRYEKNGYSKAAKGKISTEVVTKRDLINVMAMRSAMSSDDTSGIKALFESNYHEKRVEEIKSAFGYKYDYGIYSTLNSKMSVSDIKKLKAFNGAGYDDNEFEYKEISKEGFVDEEVPIKPDEERENKKVNNNVLNGAMRGTIVHKAMELVDFAALDGIDDLYTFVQNHKKQLKEQGVFDETELRAINCRKLANMLKSNLGQRMIKAATRGELFKEQQFSKGFLAREIYELDQNAETQDIIIVQGIVDGYFVEDGAIVVMDYKTDACDEETLIGRYRAQLEYYAETLSQLRGLPVKEKIMYSFSLQKEIPV